MNRYSSHSIWEKSIQERIEAERLQYKKIFEFMRQHYPHSYMVDYIDKEGNSGYIVVLGEPKRVKKWFGLWGPVVTKRNYLGTITVKYIGLQSVDWLSGTDWPH